MIDKICCFSNMYTAFWSAQRAKPQSFEILKFKENLEDEIHYLRNEILSGTYKPSGFRNFIVQEPKPRLIHAPMFMDRVVHHAIYNIINPIFERRFIYHSYACRVGKGTHAAMLACAASIDKYKKSGSVYAAHIDVSGYFYNIPRSRLYYIITKYINCVDTLHLISSIIWYNTSDFGIPIGSLSSQLFANIYLDQIDHKVTDDLGYKDYRRYMDDMVVISSDKEYVKNAMVSICDCIEMVGLLPNKKSHITKITNRRALDFCGYRMFLSKTLPRVRNVKTFKQKKAYLTGRNNAKLERVEASFNGYMKWCTQR